MKSRSHLSHLNFDRDLSVIQTHSAQALANGQSKAQTRRIYNPTHPLNLETPMTKWWSVAREGAVTSKIK